MPLKSSTLLVLMLVPLLPSPARGQQASPTWNIAGTAGLLAAHKTPPETVGYYDDWFHTFQVAVVAGRHITDRVIVEVEASASGTGRQFVEQRISVPDLTFPYSVSAEAATTIRSVGGHVTYQFRDNEWVHPFVRAGVSADIERTALRTLSRFYYPPTPGTPPIAVPHPGAGGPTSDVRARVAVGGGAKVYLSPRLFLRPEGLLSFGTDRQNFVARLGVGLDF